ncbi:hypothetical protein HQ531_01325 [bacterium]|nr:hypothetical protein [bacterium]
MKTLNYILLVLSLTGLLIAQTDSTETEQNEVDIPETVLETPDSSSTPEEEIVETESSAVEEVVLDSAVVDSSALVQDDTLEVVEPEMILVSREPDPVTIAALMNDGALYWTNDGLDGLSFDSLDYVTIEDATLIAIKANDCLDIICHLLATDSVGVDFVVVTNTDSSDFRIYNTISKVVILDAPAQELARAFDSYLRSLSGTEYMAVDMPQDTLAVTADSIAIAVDSPMPESRFATLDIRKKHFRSMDKLFSNPANLGRDYSTHTSWNIIPDFNFNFHNSLLTPGWYKKWLTVGGVWDDDKKSDFRATFVNEDIALNFSPDFNSLIGFRIGSFGLNFSAKSHIKMIMPGSLIGMPWQDIYLTEPIENAGLEIEAIPLASKTSLSYAYPVKTPYGMAKIGASLNVYEAAFYMKTVSDDFTILLTQDSVIVTGSGEGWYVDAGLEGHLDNLVTEDFKATESLSNLSFGIDLGLILDLQPRLNQEVEIQLYLRNIGATYKWSKVIHKEWKFEQRMPAPDEDALDTMELYMEEFQKSETKELGTEKDFSISVPTVFNISAIYQPHPRVLIGVGIEKALIDEDWFEYSANMEFNYQVNLYASSFWDFSYEKQTIFGDPIHSFGTGFHFGSVDTGLALSFINGLNSNATGMGFAWNSSLHF